MRESTQMTVGLGEACRLITDGSHFSPVPQVEGHPIVNAKDIPKGRIEISSCTKISKSDWLLLKAQNCAPQVGDVLLSKDGTIGRVVHYREDEGVVLLSSVAILRPGPSLDSEFLTQALRSHLFDSQVFRLQSGSALKRLVLADIRKIEVPILPLATQRRIAEILSTIDEAVEQTEARIAKSQQIKAGLMRDLFTRGIAQDGKLRPPQEEAPQLYKESPLGWIPKEWDCTELNGLLANIACPMRSGPFGSALLKEELVEVGIPLLGIDNIFAERFVASYRRYVTAQKFSDLRRYAVLPGDVVITIMGTVGRCCVLPSDIGEALSSKHLWTMTLDQKKVLPDLVCWQLNHAPWVKSWFARHSQGAVMDAIQSSTLRTLNLPVPPLNEQLLIREHYQACESALSAEAENLEKLRVVRLGLMHDLLSGRVPVSEKPISSPQKEASAHV